MDIRKFSVEETGVIHLRSADDELMYADDGKNIEIVVYGPGSKQFAKAQAAHQNKLMELLRKKGKSQRSPQDAAEDQAEFLAACTKEFRNIEYDGLTGQDLFKSVYADLSLGFIADQVNKHLGDWSNFSKPASKK
jgi:intracellular sulfur oxidation DsrE/DsrF family protein